MSHHSECPTGQIDQGAADPLWRSPAGGEIRDARLKSGRTQSQVAQILRVSERQLQRWEAGEQDMPPGVWRTFTMSCGQHFPADFELAIYSPSRGWDLERDKRRDTILKGDRVHLKAIQDGTLIQVMIWLDRTDGLIDDNSYGGTVVDFPGEPEAGQEFGGFYLGEKVTFSLRNVLHVEQRLPAHLFSDQA
ncbi:XRE family transcriptional regulator [Bordetella genomosp. 1]|uniref:XRE family transcriptional regulator n=1 Tax=Bordetella genomosp. 1 TaxID=1395607 RepID=A0A261RUC0_9BORD|nr:helix-turn-helix domain-containing protein [Bordetella genomosp. 1]OZI28669.1 XRE family transcriptional regulator [Bordetella genomosp. 1]